MRGDPVTSPLVNHYGDYLDRAITVTITFDDVTHALLGATVDRDDGCLWTTLIIGDPNDMANAKTFSVRVGRNSLNAQQLSQRGLNVIEDVLALQMTCGL